MPFYLQVNYPVSAGIQHQLANVDRHCQLAQYLEAILVPSRLVLVGRPPLTRDYSTDLSEFIDFSQIRCRGESVPVVNRPPEGLPHRELEVTLNTSLAAVEAIAADKEDRLLILNVKGEVPSNLLRSLPIFKDAEAHNKARRPEAKTFMWPMGIEAQRIGGIAAQWLGAPYTCIHVRRGDRLQESDYAANTTLEQIKKALEFSGLPRVYVMSDEQPEYFFPLREHGFEIFHYFDIPCLASLADPEVYGGHMLYVAERDLMRRADRRVVTRPEYAFEYADVLSPYNAWDYSLIPPHQPPNPRNGGAD